MTNLKGVEKMGYRLDINEIKNDKIENKYYMVMI